MWLSRGESCFVANWPVESDGKFESPWWHLENLESQRGGHCLWLWHWSAGRPAHWNFTRLIWAVMPTESIRWRTLGRMQGGVFLFFSYSKTTLSPVRLNPSDPTPPTKEMAGWQQQWVLNPYLLTRWPQIYRRGGTWKVQLASSPGFTDTRSVITTACLSYQCWA